MTRFHVRVALFLQVFFAACSIAPTALAATTALSVRLDLDDLPTTVTLCRDPAAMTQFFIDEQWGVLIDVDNSVGTGAQQFGIGADAFLIVQTLFQPPPSCVPHDAPLADSLTTRMLYWNGSTFAEISQPIAVTLDFNAHTLTIASDISGVLGGITSASKYIAAAQGAYTQITQPVTVNAQAADLAPTRAVQDAAQTLPAGDVVNCSQTCTPAVAWYPMIDLVGISASIGPGDGLFADGFEAAPAPILPNGG